MLIYQEPNIPPLYHVFVFRLAGVTNQRSAGVNYQKYIFTTYYVQ